MNCKMMAVLSVVAICAAPVLAGNVIDEDFNSGVFVATSARPLVAIDPGPWDSPPPSFNISGAADYDWGGPGDSLDGWVVHMDAYGSPGPGNIAPESWSYSTYTFDVSVAVPNGWFGQMPTGSNHIGGNNIGDNMADGLNNGLDWASTDGNIGDFHKAQNDVPKGGWSYTTQLDASMGGGRNSAGEALAFVVMYDAELNFVKVPAAQPRGKINASVVLNGTSYAADSSMFSAQTTVAPGEIDVKPFSPVAANIYDSDDTAGLTAREAVNSGVIEHAVANGEDITFRFEVGREGLNNFESSLGLGVDNLKVVALEAGDANGDLLVDAGDIGALLSGFGSGTAWTQGDFNDDDLVDASDVGDLLTNFTGDPGPAPAGSVLAEYDPSSGEIVVSVDGVQNWYIEAADGSAVMTGDPAANLPGQPGSLVTDNDFRVGESNFGGPFTYTDLSVGNVAVAGLVQGDLVAKWQTGFGAPEQSVEVVVIPEPASLALLGLGGLLVIRRRRAA